MHRRQVEGHAITTTIVSTVAIDVEIVIRLTNDDMTLAFDGLSFRGEFLHTMISCIEPAVPCKAPLVAPAG